MIKRLLILKNGLPLVHRIYESGVSPAPNNSLGDFQSSVDFVLSKCAPGVRGEEIRGNDKLSFKQSDKVVFLASSDATETGILEILLPELEVLFFAVFPKDYVNSWEGDDVSVFKGFESKLDQLRSAFENRIVTKPGSRRVLDTLSVMELPQRLQKTALAIVDAKIAAFEEVIAFTGLTPQQAVSDIQEILNAGFLYTTKVGNKVYYSVKPFSAEVQPATAPTQKEPVSAARPAAPAVKPSVTPTPKADESIPTTTETARTPGVVVKKRDVSKGNMPFLIKQIKRDLDHVFDALITNKLVLIILNPESDKNQVLLNMLLDTLQCFVPDRELRIVNHATDFIHPRDADIIRIDRKLLSFYSNEVVLDMDNKKVQNGLDSVYLDNIIKEMTKLKHSECVSLLINRVALIEKLSQDWAKIKSLNLPSEDFLNTIRAKHTPAMVEIMDRVADNVYAS